MIPDTKREETDSALKESELSDQSTPVESQDDSASLGLTQDSAVKQANEEYTSKLDKIIKNFSMVLNVKM